MRQSKCERRQDQIRQGLHDRGGSCARSPPGGRGHVVLIFEAWRVFCLSKGTNTFLTKLEAYDPYAAFVASSISWIVVLRLVDTRRNRPHPHQVGWEWAHQITRIGLFAEPTGVIGRRQYDRHA